MHVPNAQVKSVDPYKRHISTKAGDFDFDEAILMPPHQAADMVWHAGLIGKGPDGKPTTWGDIDNKFFTAKSDDRVYIIGDSIGQVSPLFGHYPKSAHVASTLGRIVAKNLSQRVAGKTVERILPDNLCYMMVNLEPQEEISVLFDYELDALGRIVQNQVDVDVRSADMVKDDFAWINGKFSEFLVP